METRKKLLITTGWSLQRPLDSLRMLRSWAPETLGAERKARVLVLLS